MGDLGLAEESEQAATQAARGAYLRPSRVLGGRHGVEGAKKFVGSVE